MSEEIKNKILNFVKNAEEYQKLEVSNVPNVILQVFPDKKFGKVARVCILPEGSFKAIVLNKKRFETIKEIFSKEEYVQKIENLINIVEELYSRKKEEKKAEKIEI